MLVNIIIFLLLIRKLEYDINSSAGTLKNVRVDVCYVVCTIVKISYIVSSLSLSTQVYIPCIYAYIRMYMFMYVCYLHMGMCQAFLIPWQIPRICAGSNSIFEIVSPEE
jgi:hypothetical protein